MRRVQVRVHGRVQGVMFRDTARREAERLGLAGWVRNEPDGSVALEAEGHSVDELVTWAHTGPPGARVERVDVDEISPAGGNGFEVRW